MGLQVLFASCHITVSPTLSYYVLIYCCIIFTLIHDPNKICLNSYKFGHTLSEKTSQLLSSVQQSKNPIVLCFSNKAFDNLRKGLPNDLKRTYCTFHSYFNGHNSEKKNMDKLKNTVRWRIQHVIKQMDGSRLQIFVRHETVQRSSLFEVDKLILTFKLISRTLVKNCTEVFTFFSV